MKTTKLSKINKSDKKLHPPPSIQVLGTKENPDGSLNVEIEYQKDWVELVKKDLNKKKVTKKDVEKHFIDLLTKAANKKDGYKLERLIMI